MVTFISWYIYVFLTSTFAAFIHHFSSSLVLLLLTFWHLSQSHKFIHHLPLLTTFDICQYRVSTFGMCVEF